MRAPQTDAFSLRAFVKAAQVISAPPAAGKSPHVLGLGISARNVYRSLSGVSRLPSVEAGLTHLRASTAVPVPGLPLNYSAGAWGALLGRPQLVVDLPSTQLDDFLAAGEVLPQGVGKGALRRLGLAVLAMPDSVALTDERELVATPVAGVAQLVLATMERADISSDAWILAHWYDSAEETAAALAYLHALSGAGPPRSLPVSAVLLTDSGDAWYGDALDERIITCAALLDYQIAGYRPQDYLRRALLHVKKTPPDLLLVADSSPARCEAVVDAYLATPKASGIRYFAPGDVGALVSSIRRRLIVASGISLNLLQIAKTAPAQLEPPRGRLPIVHEGRRLYHRGRMYIEALETGYFYTIDTAGHAKVASKRYVMRADGLYWDADLDENGQVVVGKFKGKIGMVIPLRELSGG